MTSPASTPPAATDLVAFLRDHPRVMVLTGAGVSTHSGIPDYRDLEGDWKRPAPMTLQQFMGSELARQRYWARSMLGWPRMQGAQPNAAHDALAALQVIGHVTRLVTQNVDGLHERAGSRDVIALHGRIDRVRCMDCELRLARDELQRWLEALNPEWLSLEAATAPDGDVDLEGRAFADFHVPPCPRCGGVLKPDVVFFGESVPRQRVDAALAALRASDALLVAGSSLMVYSGYRFALAAERAGTPVAIVNHGHTRADDVATLKIDGECGAILTAVVSALQERASG